MRKVGRACLYVLALIIFTIVSGISSKLVEFFVEFVNFDMKNGWIGKYFLPFWAQFISGYIAVLAGFSVISWIFPSLNHRKLAIGFACVAGFFATIAIFIIFTGLFFKITPSIQDVSQIFYSVVALIFALKVSAERNARANG